jgi:DNA-binding NarL/FixJ family response regulator
MDALTPTEHRVATLAAHGHSNPDIAQQLYVTRRTVETHLTHAFQKLDITTRADLAARLTDERHPDAAATSVLPLPPVVPLKDRLTG